MGMPKFSIDGEVTETRIFESNGKPFRWQVTLASLGCIFKVQVPEEQYRNIKVGDHLELSGNIGFGKFGYEFSALNVQSLMAAGGPQKK